MSGPFFSVIVPVHSEPNVIIPCLQSIGNQHFDDFETIYVCDNCTDETIQTVKGYLPDKLIITNYGMDGLARNAGIDAAEGEWILFLDDDDWWMHEYVLDEIWKVAWFFGEEFDMIVFDFIWKGQGYTSVKAEELNIAVWSKAFKRELIGETRFPGIRMTSDRPFMEKIVAKKPRTYSMKKLMYYYNYLRKGSQTEQYNARREESAGD